jgi:hypothetical protein
VTASAVIMPMVMTNLLESSCFMSTPSPCETGDACFGPDRSAPARSGPLLERTASESARDHERRQGEAVEPGVGYLHTDPPFERNSAGHRCRGLQDGRRRLRDHPYPGRASDPPGDVSTGGSVDFTAKRRRRQDGRRILLPSGTAAGLLTARRPSASLPA